MIHNKEFDKAMLDEQLKTFIIYIAALKTLSKLAKMIIYHFQVAQLCGDNYMQIAAL